MKRTWWAALMVMALAVPGFSQNYEEGDDPEHGVARLSLLSGDVSVQRGDTGEVVAGELNAPLVALDHVLTGSGSRAEVQFDFATMIRLGPASEVRLGEMRDGNYLVQVAEGTTTFRILRDTKAQVEISTPTVSVRPIEKGIYRITVRPDGVTEITVRDGRADIFTPRGTETLRSGKTMEARGTASDPEFKIVSALGKDDWDRWNENRDKDLDRYDDSYKYVSSSIPGAYDLNGYGRWVYDSPYGWVWVPNANPGWAPYRVGRWSWVNYYGWTWISGDPWGWAPYHYGNWYSSPYGWAWYPGSIGYRYYWRPAMVGFFGWGSPGLSVGVSFGSGWGYGNIGWVPLAPYERFRPWYGRGYNNTTIVNNNIVVNNTNITNVYRNARVFNGRDGVTSINATNFGRQRIDTNNFVRVDRNDLNRAGQVQGALPVTGNQDSRRFSDRQPGADTAARAGRARNVNFATVPGSNGGNGPAGGQDRGGRGFAGNTGGTPNPNQGGFANGGNTRGDRGAGAIDRSATAVDRGAVDRGNRGNAGVQNSRDGGALNNQNPANNSGGWRRFDPNTANANQGRGGFSTRGGNPGNGGGRQATEAAPNATPRGQNDNRGGFGDRRGGAAVQNVPQQQAPAQSGGGFGDRRAIYDRAPQQQPQQQSFPQQNFPQGGNQGGGFGSRRGASGSIGQQPVQINPPIVRDRGNSGGGFGRVERSAPSMGNIGGGRPSGPPPSAPSGGGGGGGTIRGGGGNGGGSRGGGGGNAGGGGHGGRR